MVRALVQIKDKNSAFSLTVCAENLRRAVEIASDRYPGYDVSVQFPLDPEVFFVRGLPPSPNRWNLRQRKGHSKSGV